MAIASVATEYVFSDFLLKEPTQGRYRTLRTELAVDKIVTCVAVGLPLLLISLAFAQEVSVGTQISCFPPSNFSWRQAIYVDSFCWAAVHTHTLPLWLHKFFPYILLLVAVMMYTPALFWRFTAAPRLQSDLSFIMEELDRCYNRAVTLAKRMAMSDLPTADSDDPTEGCFMYPLVEKYLMTKRYSRSLLWRYLLCRIMTMLTLLCACIYLGYYLRLATITDQFGCLLRSGLLANDTSVPEQVQCKLIAVGVFTLLSFVNLLLFIGLVPVVIYASLRPLLCEGYAHFLQAYQSLPTVSIMPSPAGQWDDLALYLLFLEENLSELKSYKYIKVLELLRKQGAREGEEFDSMGLLQTLCLVKTDTTDGNKATIANANPNGNPKTNAKSSQTAEQARGKGPEYRPISLSRDQSSEETEMREFSPLLSGNTGATSGQMKDEGAVRHRVV
ncbi:pannexin-1a [Aplochiton taeniatus]